MERSIAETTPLVEPKVAGIGKADTILPIMTELKYLHALRLTPEVGNKTLKSLIEHFGSAEAVWHADAPELRKANEVGPKTADAIIASRERIHIGKAWEILEKNQIGIIPFTDRRYPTLLKEIPDAPYLLYVRGNFDWSASFSPIAIVGSRKYTSYGDQSAFRLASDLARAGYTIVSGLAFGIDAIAHKAALDAGRETLAVMGNGLDEACLYPRTNVPLAHAIERNGALVSEYPPGTRVNEGTFPARNRIIAGMSLGTVVIEADEMSGSLITARLALEYDREVFAVPGSIFSSVSRGCNQLIKQGAKIVTGVQDILEELPAPVRRTTGNTESGTARHGSLSDQEEKMLSCLSHEPLHVDKVARQAKLSAAETGSLLAMMEIKGIVRNIGGMNYIKL